MTMRTTLKVVLVWLSIVVVAACLTLLYMSMRAVMGVGGFCAEGGPYVIETSCPTGVGWIMPVSMWVGVFACALYVFAGRGLPGPKWIGLVWPALFLSLGWNFWEFGLDPGDGSGTAYGFIVCGVVFVAMGLVPLVIMLAVPASRRWVSWGDATPARGRDTYRQTRDTVKSIDWRALGTVVGAVPTTPTTAPHGSAGSTIDLDGRMAPDVVDRLERLGEMHRRGDITSEEFDTAKRHVLGDQR